MLVNRYDVSAVLQRYGVTIFVTPAGIDYGAVQSGLYYAIGRSRYVYGRMGGHIESIRHHAYKRGKEVNAFDREVTLDARRQAVLLFRLHSSPKYRILLL